MVVYRKCTLQHRGKIIYFAFNYITIMLYVFEKSFNNFWSYLFLYILIGLDEILIIVLPLNVRILIQIPKINLTLNIDYIWNFKSKLLQWIFMLCKSEIIELSKELFGEWPSDMKERDFTLVLAEHVGLY